MFCLISCDVGVDEKLFCTASEILWEESFTRNVISMRWERVSMTNDSKVMVDIILCHCDFVGGGGVLGVFEEKWFPTYKMWRFGVLFRVKWLL